MKVPPVFWRLTLIVLGFLISMVLSATYFAQEQNYMCPLIRDQSMLARTEQLMPCVVLEVPRTLNDLFRTQLIETFTV